MNPGPHYPAASATGQATVTSGPHRLTPGAVSALARRGNRADATPSAAGTPLVGHSVDGWVGWRVPSLGNQSLADLRVEFLERRAAGEAAQDDENAKGIRAERQCGLTRSRRHRARSRKFRGMLRPERPPAVLPTVAFAARLDEQWSVALHSEKDGRIGL